MDKKTLIIYGVALLVIEFLLSSGIFVTYQSMASYAAPKSDVEIIMQHLVRIENKLDRLIMERY